MNDSHLFKAARKASKNADYTGANGVQIGCVAVYKGTILAKGCNSDRTHPMQERYNRFRYKNVGNRYLPAKCHAETAVISKLKNLDIDFSKVKIYLYREYKNGKLGPSAPCPSCEKMLMNLGIRTIFYTTDYGYEKRKILRLEK